VHVNSKVLFSELLQWLHFYWAWTKTSRPHLEPIRPPTQFAFYALSWRVYWPVH